MGADSTTECWLFSGLERRPVSVTFDEPRTSSDGGAILLRAAERRYGLIGAMAGCVEDAREQSRVKHEIEELMAQRVYAIACGYPDGNDAARLSEDPVHKLLVGRDPIEGEALASQPTLSRFENSVARGELYRMGVTLAESVIERHRCRLKGRARLVTIDLDQTEDPTHGQQQLALFNGYYGNWCYLPLMGFISFDQETDQYLCAAILRPGNAPDKRGAIGTLERLLARLRAAFPKARLRVRLDAGFASGDVFDFLDEQDVEYVVAMPKNSRLLSRAGALMVEARRLSELSGKSEKVFGETLYAARRWSNPRRVIIKAEVTRIGTADPKDNPRFVVTNLRQSPRWVYEKIYCQRGEVENRLKELHHGLEIDRTSCTRFFANQLRVFLAAAAYVLMQELRLSAAHTALARAQVCTLRDTLLKVAARVSSSVRRIALRLPASFPDRGPWGSVARTLAAVPA